LDDPEFVFVDNKDEIGALKKIIEEKKTRDSFSGKLPKVMVFPDTIPS
jgi:hypothetical protein